MGAYSKLTYHIIFGTKYRKPLIDDALREPIYEYSGGIIRSFGGHLIEIGGIENHVHLLVNVPAKIALSDFVRKLKSNSSKWVRENSKLDCDFQWQIGYGAFTVSFSQTEVVRKYIQNQIEHHRELSFEEEFERLLRKHEIDFARQYLFAGEQVG